MQSSPSCKLPARFVVLLALLLVSFCAARATAQAVDPATDHLVSSQTLQQQVENSAAARQKNIETLNKMLTMPVAQKGMHDAKIDPVQVKNAIPTLSDDELANLAGRVTKAQSDFSAGVLGFGLLSLIIILVIVIIVVSAVH